MGGVRVPALDDVPVRASALLAVEINKREGILVERLNRGLTGDLMRPELDAVYMLLHKIPVGALLDECVYGQNRYLDLRCLLLRGFGRVNAESQVEQHNG